MSLLLSDADDECSDRRFRKLESFLEVTVMHSHRFSKASFPQKSEE